MEDLDRAWHGFHFDIRRSIRYHNRRRVHFDRLDRLTNMVSIVFGSAAVFGVLEHRYQALALTAAAIVTVVSAINLVMGSSMRARDHAEFARRFVLLEKEIVASAPDAETLKQLTAKRLDIEVDEPPVLRVLDCLCHNEEMRAQGYPKEQLANIRWWQALLSPLIDVREDLIRA
jgi:hypothetical protein